jgi:exonuclease VII small subunit
LRDVAEERQRVRCLKAVISKGRNLNADEYAEILGTTDPNTAGYIRKVTTIDPSNDKDAELKLDNAERRLDNAERRLDNAERRLKEANQELDNAELKVKEAEAKRYRIENTPFEWDATLAQKKRLAQGPGARLLGSLKGRSKGLSEIKEGYKILARQRGSVASKKNVPIIACAAISGAGKTEMLTHVVNSHGHHADGDNSEADEILNIINGESPEHATPLTKLVTFFCSFNSLSPYKDTEDPVIELTTVERMIRTYSGNRDFEYSKKMSIDITFKTLIDRIPDDVGVIMCLDEVGLLSDKARRVLLLAAMSCCETLIDRGRFAAIVATSLYFWVWNKSVYSGSNRTIHPFTLQALPSDESLLIGIRDVLIEKYLKTPTSPEDNFTVNVIARLLSQECKPQQWVNYFTTNRTLVHPTPTAIAPNDDLDESTVFEWIAPAIIGKPHVTILFAKNKELVKGLQSRYGEFVITSGTEADTLRGETRLPAVRFLQLSWERNKYVGIWTQRALAECMGAQSVVELRKRWELGAIALLEVWRCAMRAVDPSATFQLKDLPIFRNWDGCSKNLSIFIRVEVPSL